MSDLSDEQVHVCTRCKVLKPRSEFWKNFNKPRGYCKSCNRVHSKNKRDATRLRVLKHYGGDPPQCACCGIAVLEFLAIHHKNGNGKQHRKEIGVGNGTSFYDWLVTNHFPVGFGVLCHNCNFADGHYGACPHKKQQEAISEH